jgi:predicted nucleotidyltransferase
MKIRGIKSLCRECYIELLILFGSSAKRNSKDANDIDLAIKLIKGKNVSKLDLIYKLEDVFREKQIDIVVLTVDTDPLLLNEIFNGKCMYEKKKGIFEKEKLRAWKLYLDTAKIRNMRSKYLKDFVKKVSHVA